MAARTKPPFRADHVGSLLRPPALLRAREDAAAGRIAADELRAAEDAAIGDAVRMQEDVGLRGVTDGEFRRSSWHMDFIYALDGISTADDKVKVSFHNEEGDLEFMAAALHVDGKVGVAADHGVRGVACGPHDQPGVELLTGRQDHVPVARGNELGIEVNVRAALRP